MADAVAAREVRERRLISFGPSPRRIARGGRPFIEYINPEFGPLHDPAFNGRRYVCVMWPGVRVRMLSITTTTKTWNKRRGGTVSNFSNFGTTALQAPRVTEPHTGFTNTEQTSHARPLPAFYARPSRPGLLTPGLLSRAS